MEIQVRDDVPDSTYFTTGDVEPRLAEGAIQIFDGKGSRRSWGGPGVTSTVVFQSTDLVAIHTGFHHKHGGGQFWRYFSVNGEVKQVAWKDLDDDTRQAVLDAYDKNAPGWAKTPGKLRKHYLSANPKANAFEAYKVVGIDDDGRLHSLYDPTETYELGKLKVQASKPNHNGGWYVYPTEEVLDKYLAGGVVAKKYRQEHVALIKCECWGNVEYYDADGSYLWYGRPSTPTGKMAVTYCRPVEVIKTV